MRQSTRNKIHVILLFPLFILLITNCSPHGNKNSYTDKSGIHLPPGFKISIYTSDVPGAREMTLGSNGVLFVGTRGEGKVYAVLDTNKDYKADEVITIAGGLNMPNGVAFKNGALYVAEINRIIRYDNIETQLRNPPRPVVINDSFPDKQHHGWKFIKFGPDGKLYIPVGAPCNVCISKDSMFATIMRMNPDGTDLEIFAKGIRNSVGFDWNPRTNVLWFTDNGRDLLGDNIPPDELNRAPHKGMNFGFPYVYGDNIPDPQFGKGVDINQFTKPVEDLGPHVAALGMLFYTGNMFPNQYKNQIFIAEHGSWNRSKKIGYRITLVKLDDNNHPISYQPFAYGWLKGESVTGRPVAVLQMPDGSLLISDDFNGVIYRISYSNPN